MKKEVLAFNREVKHLHYEKLLLEYNLNTESSTKIIENVKEQENSNQIGNDVILVFSRKKRKIEYLTKNVFDLIGYSVEEITKWETAIFFKLANWSHIDFLQKSQGWAHSFTKAKLKNKDYSNKNTKFICGLKTDTKSNGVLTLLVKSFNPGTNDDNSDIIIYYFSDISHLYKGDYYWGNFVSENNSTNQFRHSSMDVKTTKNIISVREKEVLLATMKGNSKIQVGILLNISPETVSKHKKNMIARTGAKDTTSLVHLLKMCRLI